MINYIFLLGDIINNPDGINLTNKLNYILNTLAGEYEYILYIPGNHDLRGKKNLFNGFELKENVFMPKSKDLLLEIEDKKILLTNIFYNLNL